MQSPPIQLGIHQGVSQREYLATPGLGFSALQSLSISPLHYRYSMSQPGYDTDATFLGTALHAAVLQPDAFAAQYVYEPDLAELVPDAKSPRATNIYKAWVAEQAAIGRSVLKPDTGDAIRRMVDAIHGHPHAKAALAKAPEREVALIWERDGRRCRGRADALGPGVLIDVKTTRDLRSFSPWIISRMGYHRQFGWYRDGLERLGRTVDHCIVIAVDPEAVAYGAESCGQLLDLLSDCERADKWPGQFPNVERGMLTDAIVAGMVETIDEGVDA